MCDMELSEEYLMEAFISVFGITPEELPDNMQE